MQIVHREDMFGKTIEKIITSSDEDFWCFYFTDGTHAILQSEGENEYGTCSNICILDHAITGANERLELGFITREEYDEIQEKTRKALTENREKQERRTLEMLKQKYGE